MRAQLISLDGGSPVEINRDVTLVGRGEDCDLQLTHKSVSKIHCLIVRTDGLLMLRDLGSTNGTRVNGQRVRRAALLPNDQLHIASLRYRVLLGPGEAPLHEHEHTQNIDAAEVNRLLRKEAVPLADEMDDEKLPPSIRQNALPDVYEQK